MKAASTASVLLGSMTFEVNAVIKLFVNVYKLKRDYLHLSLVLFAAQDVCREISKVSVHLPNLHCKGLQCFHHSILHVHDTQ